ncbi:MAG TPA: hypothetical protein EYG78_00525 [Sulfurovum sp.]|nr:hypothetical protein [Sulfurovum sp.]
MHHVVILGGSYGGIAALRRVQINRDVRVTLVDHHPYHYLQTEGYELISGDTYFDKTIVNLSTLCANYENVTFRHSSVEHIDPETKSVHLSDGIEMYDTLIIALGSVTKRFQCDARVYNYSSGAKSLLGALKLNRFFQDELYKRLESARYAKENFNIIVRGAGLSAAEMRQRTSYVY